MAKPVFKTTRQKAGSFSVEVPAGATIFDEGELGTEMYIIQSGTVEIAQILGGEIKVLATLDKGDFFGEMSLLEDLPRTATAKAVTDCKLVEINGSTFDEMLKNRPEIAVRIMRKLSRRLRLTDQLLKDALAGRDVERSGIDGPAPEETVVRPAGPQRLVHSSGASFLMGAGRETLVGRRDPVTGIHPDVDLTTLDDQRSTSRRHAKILREGDTFMVIEEIGTMNGTFVRGERVETGVPVEVRPGDEVQFGLVKMQFLAE